MLIGIGLLITACGGGAALPAPTEAPAAAEEVATTAAPAVTEEAAATEAPAATEEAATTEASAAAKILRIRLPGEPQNGDPAFWIGAEEPIMLSVYEGLVSYKPGTWEVVNTLAETITRSEDRLKVEFKLKEGIQFHGGYGEVTAEDVKFSFERIAGLTDPPLESPYSGDWVALDPYFSQANMIMLARYAPHPHAAALFLDWSLSEEGQTIVTSFGRVVARNGVKQRFPELMQKKSRLVDMDLIDPKVEKPLIKEFREIFIPTR
jgi:ABC-type transport system substrate-binding protein